jgi:serpin B
MYDRGIGMRNFFAAVLFGGLLFLLCSCVKTSTDVASDHIKEVVYPKAIAFEDFDAQSKLREENPIDDRFIKSINRFSYDTAQALLKNKTDNFNYSPLSLYYALALAGTGADGETKHQIFDLLGLSSEKDLHEQCGNYYRLLYTDNQISKLKIANSIWLDDAANMKSGFVSDAAEYFYASTFQIDFSDEESEKAMAQWISDHTNGTITPELNVNPNQILSIINTVYFYDEWVDRFDESLTKKDTFHTDSKDVAVDFMNQTCFSSEFYEGDRFTRSSLGLKENGQMVFILPDQGVSISDLISSNQSLRSLFEDGERYMGEVIWEIPKFNYDSKCELSETLKGLGMKKAFETDANFSDITDSPAYISDILQQTHIAINEQGVEASAFTQISYSGMALPEGKAEMVLNRPFLYGITTTAGTLVFVGVCNDPSVLN